jgi:hypothetical protein
MPFQHPNPPAALVATPELHLVSAILHGAGTSA